MYNKTIIRFGFCDHQNNQGLGKGYQPQPSASVDNSYLGVDYSGVSQKLHPIIVYKQINSFCLTMVRETFWMVNWVAGHTR